MGEIMDKVLKVNNLTYKDFYNISIDFEKGIFYSVVGGNKSGKTTLFAILTRMYSGLFDIYCDGVEICDDTYIKKIGVVERVNAKSFHFNKVIDEMSYPLYNLNYNRKRIFIRINEILNIFNAKDMLNKKIDDLSLSEKQLLLIMISLLHQPKVLLLDSVLNVFDNDDKNNVLKAIDEIKKESQLCIISFTNNLNDTWYSDKLIIINNFKIIQVVNSDIMYDDDKIFYENNLEVPFIYDLTIKLKAYNLINNNFDNISDMVDSIWQ